MIEKACCVTGHRNIPAEKLDYVKQELQREVSQAIEDGYTHFISGFAEGVDLMFASIVVDLTEKNPTLTLEAAIPYRKRLNTSNELFLRLLGKCKIVGVHSEAYSSACYGKRNRKMVALSQRVVAVYDGRENGGTFSTIRYANLHNREVRVVRI